MKCRVFLGFQALIKPIIETSAAVLFLSLSWGSLNAQADEQLGEISLSDFLVEPAFLYSERGSVSGAQESGFGLGNTYFAAEWKLPRVVSGRLMLGSGTLLNRPSWSPYFLDNGLQFVEAYAQLENPWGRVRAGLIPIAFGLEGSRAETFLWLPRTLLFSNSVLGLRDLGFSYAMEHNHFFTESSVHNGEGGNDSDQRLWYNTRAGWLGPAGIVGGISGSVGYFKSSTDFAHTKFRAGNAFVGIDLYTVGGSAEVTVGDQKNNSGTSQFTDWDVMVRHGLGEGWGALVRYEFYDPSDRIDGDSVKQGIGGLYFANETNTSRVEVLFLKNWEENVTTANDEVRVSWRITSSYIH